MCPHCGLLPPAAARDAHRTGGSRLGRSSSGGPQRGTISFPVGRTGSQPQGCKQTPTRPEGGLRGRWGQRWAVGLPWHESPDPGAPQYLVQHLQLDHQLHAGQGPHPHAPVITACGTVGLTGAENHLIHLQGASQPGLRPHGPWVGGHSGPDCPNTGACPPKPTPVTSTWCEETIKTLSWLSPH